MKLSEIKQGDCEILSVPSVGDAAKRLARLGIAAGQRVRLLRRAPFGGGVLLEAGGARVALRGSIAAEIGALPAPPLPPSSLPSPPSSPAAEGCPPFPGRAARALPARGRGRAAGRDKRAEKVRLLLFGSPNCGKSTLFNALTGAHAKTGNWHGVTVGEQWRNADLGGVSAQVCDLPGFYAGGTFSLEERVSLRALEGEEGLAVCVADALTLPRSLPLIERVLARGGRAALVVTMCDVLKKRGGYLNVSLLSARLGIPVIGVCAHRRADIARLRAFLRDAAFLPAHEPAALTPALFAGVWSAGEEREGLFERLLYHPVFAPLFFAAAVLLAFFLAFGEHMPGVLLKGLIEGLLSERAGGAAEAALAAAGAPAAGAFVGALFSGMGMLLSFLPQIAVLQLCLLLLEESGCMSALAFMTDGLFRRIGLTGRAVFCVLMGFGCTATAILSARGLENEKLVRRAVRMLAYISCSAKMPVYLAVVSCFFPHRFLALAGIYLAGVLLALASALLSKGKEEEAFVMETARLRLPPLSAVCRALLFSLKQFIIKIVTVVAAFLVVLWFLLSFSFSFRYVGQGAENSMLAVLCRGLKYLFYPMGITQWQVALAALSGIVAKENVAGTLALFYGEDLSAAMSAPSACAFLVFLLTCSPCVSAVAASAKAVGVRRALLYAAGQTGSAFLLGYAVYALLRGGAALAAAFSAALLLAAAAYLIVRSIRHEKIHRSGKHKPSRLHRRRLSAGFFRPSPPSPGERGARQRRKDGAQRAPLPGRRGDVFHHPERGGKALLPRSVPRRKHPRRR